MSMSMYGQKLTKRDLINCLVCSLGADPNNVVMLDEFESPIARHVCSASGNPMILTLNVGKYNVPTDMGCVSVQYVGCPYCRKLMIDKSSLDVY